MISEEFIKGIRNEGRIILYFELSYMDHRMIIPLFCEEKLINTIPLWRIVLISIPSLFCVKNEEGEK
ncbi:unnamed protein product [Onchocerca flexuosa]|uniref:PRC domain-containing protein n=1 Tax=Onchocerca flexuosa TaxID=387005 RepID=A0A183HB24_9BILA|nr:unnamed protein product [Onchocerca flexuosa]